LLTVADAAQNKKHAREPAAPAADQSEPPAKRTRTAKGQAAKGRTAKGKAPAHGDGQATSPSPPEGPTSQSLPEDDDEDNVDPVFAVDVLDAEEPETTTPNMIVKPIAENGLTRIGPQPRQSHAEDIRSAPREIIESRLNLFLRIVFKSTDKALGSRRETLDDVGSELLRSLVQHGESSVKRPCDNTGFDIVFTSGPRSMFVEAVYPYVYSDDKLEYHAHSNVCIIMTFLNWLKGKHAIRPHQRRPRRRVEMQRGGMWPKLQKSYSLGRPRQRRPRRRVEVRGVKLRQAVQDGESSKNTSEEGT
jgi:hypothetical protein